MGELPRIALSIRQPWAWAILHAGKDIENRGWPTGIRGPVCIHASKGMTREERDDFRDFAVSIGVTPPDFDALPRGALVGVAEITDCVRESRSPWFFGPYGFRLINARPVEPIPCRGSLGFFRWKADAPATTTRRARKAARDLFEGEMG